ncbi:MAG: amino acid-binding protein [Phycisphaerae bacterium]|nr:amino acid-binding protein [Phycisphaerae bacterium]
MQFEITKAEVWAGETEDRPGTLSDKLQNLMRAGANLDFVIARPSRRTPGCAVVFVAPLIGPAQEQAAQEVGLHKTGIHCLRLVGPDRPGLGAGITRKLADAGLNLTGLSASVAGEQCVFYFRFSTADDVVAAAQVLTSQLS